MNNFVSWKDIRAISHRLAELRRACGVTQHRSQTRWASPRVGYPRSSRGNRWPGRARRYAAALGGRLHQAIYFDDGDIAAIA